jgi:hypothetical protein
MKHLTDRMKLLNGLNPWFLGTADKFDQCMMKWGFKKPTLAGGIREVNG